LEERKTVHEGEPHQNDGNPEDTDQHILPPEEPCADNTERRAVQGEDNGEAEDEQPDARCHPGFGPRITRVGQPRDVPEIAR
jgi:hypothetical protein